jgi:hypothetical protein
MDELDRLLNSVGKKVFVRYHAWFADLRMPASEIIDMLPQDYTLKSRQSRTSKARRIFREGWQREALQRIADSEKTDAEAAALAGRLLKPL